MNHLVSVNTSTKRRSIPALSEKCLEISSVVFWCFKSETEFDVFKTISFLFREIQCH